jgi:hypothetical protein
MNAFCPAERYVATGQGQIGDACASVRKYVPERCSQTLTNQRSLAATLAASTLRSGRPPPRRASGGCYAPTEMPRSLVAAFIFLQMMLVSASAASAKGPLRPGDLRVCGAGARCVAIVEQPVLNSLRSFYDGPGQRPVAAAPRLGEPAFQLAGRSGYVTGIVVGARFLSYGINLNRFNTSVWYRLPSRAARALGILSGPLRPRPLTACALRLSNAGATSQDLVWCPFAFVP